MCMYMRKAEHVLGETRRMGGTLLSPQPHPPSLPFIPSFPALGMF